MAWKQPSRQLPKLTKTTDPAYTPLTPGVSIDNSDAVIRRIAHTRPDMMTTDRITGKRRPSSGAFKPDVDGVSVYSRDGLGKCGLEPSAVRRNEENALATVPVSQITHLAFDRIPGAKLTVVGDPWPEHENPIHKHARDAAHCLIQGMEGLSTGERKAFQTELAKLSVVSFDRVT